MTDYKKAFIDTAPFIYFIEKNENNPQYYDRVRRFFSNGYDANKKFVTSVITMEEYFVFPYRKNWHSDQYQAYPKFSILFLQTINTKGVFKW